MEISTRLQTIVEKLEKLQKNREAVMAENTALRTANEALEQKLYAMEERLAAVKHNFSEHAPAKVEEQQAGIRAVLDQDIRQQIDHYLSEIDQCIDWLRQQ